eukprot:15454931-Alexandrium_andersonii.AAC.1
MRQERQEQCGKSTPWQTQRQERQRQQCVCVCARARALAFARRVAVATGHRSSTLPARNCRHPF